MYIVKIDLGGKGYEADRRYLSKYGTEWATHFKIEFAYPFASPEIAGKVASMHQQWKHYEIIELN